MVFCNDRIVCSCNGKHTKVTILILIDGFLQCGLLDPKQIRYKSHNPYFNRWFSAIGVQMVAKIATSKSQSLF